MKRSDVEKLERLIGQIDGLRQELGGLAKKSPNDAVNAFKLKVINQLLSTANAFLGKKYKPLDSFAQFEDDAAPSTSDVTFILAQYAEALELIRSDNIQQFSGFWYYRIDDQGERVRTAPPASLERKR